MMKYGFVVLVSVLLLGCSLKQNLVQYSGNFSERSIEFKKKSACRNPLEYAPDTTIAHSFPVKKMRVAFQYLVHPTVGQFLDQETAELVTDRFVKRTNDIFNNLQPMWLPIGNNTPVVPAQLQLVIGSSVNNPSGVLIREDDDVTLQTNVTRGKERNLYDHDQFNTYKVDEDSILNVFVMFQRPDSIKKEGYANFNQGIGRRNYHKLVMNTPIEYLSDSESARKKFKNEVGNLATNFAHELGHTLGLQHSWITNDGCDDTPKHKNCWDRHQDGCANSPSNNLMDYNNTVNSLTPCQVGKMQQSILKLSNPVRGFFVEDWCRYHSDRTVVIPKLTDHVWKGAKDLEGDLVIRKNASLEIKCRLSLPKGAKIVLEEGAQLIVNGGYIHNCCGDHWEGIFGTKALLPDQVQIINDGQVLDVKSIPVI